MRRLHWVGSPAVLLLALTAVACIDTAAPTLDVSVPVAAITVQPAVVTTNVGKQLPLSAIALDPQGKELAGQSIIWSSADTSIAAVSDAGEVTARRVGSTIITASNGTKTGTATLTVLAPQVASVALSPATAALLAGDTARFAAQPRDDEAQPIAGRSVKWSVANPAIAKITGGVLVGLAAGTTVAVATVDGVSDSASITVSARPIASVAVVPGSVTLKRGNTTLLNTTVLDDRGMPSGDNTVVWSSADTTVATVSSTGQVSALSTGTTTITATVTEKGNNGKGKTGKGQVKVVTTDAPIASITVSPATSSLVTGLTEQLTATPKDSTGTPLGGRTIAWASSNASVATVSASGLVTAVAAGSATITASSEGQSGSAAVTVTRPAVASLSVTPSSAELLVGETTTLSATTFDADGKTLTGRTISWSTGRSSVATVSASGVVTGVAAGSAWIFATSEGEKDSAAVVVSLPPVASVTIAPSSTTLEVGATQALSVTLKDASGATLTGRTVTWVSSDKAVATVSSSGVVSAVGAGGATVTAASEGKTGTASVTVSAPQQPASSDPAPTGEHGGYFVSPSGSGGAAGSSSAPWDLATALAGGNGKIQPGDTVWLRQGTYTGRFRSTLSGSSSAPIIVRQYPGERATINGSIAVDGRYTWYWGFEVANTDASTIDVMGIDSHCPGCRFINLVIHDHSGNGLGMWSEGPDQEAYGNIIYNNGFHGANDHPGHGIYAQNVTGAKKLLDNILFNQFGYGVHIYTESGGMNNFTLDGNAVINSGQQDGMDYQVGGMQLVVNLVFTNNMSYRSPAIRDHNTARIGYDWGPTNSGAIVTGNYLVGKLLMPNWSSMTFSGNTVLDGTMPTTTKVVVEPNHYEAGRASVIVYNWGGQGSVSVDLSKVLRSGDSYEVRNVQSFYGSPVASGSYGGGSVSIPMSSVTPPRVISGQSTSSTGTEFAVFVVTRK